MGCAPSFYGEVWLQLLAEGDLTAGVKGSEYAERRQRLADALPAGSVAIIPAASTSYMAGLIPYPYRQVCTVPMSLLVWIPPNAFKLNRHQGHD